MLFSRCSRDLITTRVSSQIVLKDDIRGLCWTGAQGFEGSEAWVIFQEAPKMLPGGQIQWYFEPFWSPGAPGLHFEVWARRQSDLLSYSRDLTTTRVSSQIVLKGDIRGLCWAGAQGFKGSEAWVIFQEAPKRLPGCQIQWHFEPFWSPGAPGLHFEV